MVKSELLKNIIEILLECGSYMSVAQMAEQLHVSTKTIHNYLNQHQLQAFIRPVVFEKKQKLGIRLIGTEEELDALRSTIAAENRNRIVKNNLLKLSDYSCILQMLFTSAKPCTTQELGDMLFMSKTSVHTHFIAIEDWLKRRNIQLMKKENHGIWLEGNERFIREAYKDYCLNISMGEETLNLTSFDRLDRNHYNRIVMIFTKEVTDKTIQIALLAEIILNQKMTENSLFYLIIKLNILINRICIHKIIIKPLQDVKKLHEYLGAQVMKIHIEEMFKIKIPENELYEITEYLLETRLQKNNLIENNPTKLSQPLAGKFLQNVAQCLQVDLANDEDLIHNLLLHLQPAIRRIKYGAKIENPLIYRIRQEFTNIYLAVLTSIEELEKYEQVAFDSNEIGYICLHIAAAINRRERGNYIKTCLICNGGITITQYLESAIQREVREIQIVKTCVSDDFNYLTIGQFDLILDATYMIKNDQAKLIQIQEMFSKEDISRIRHWILGKCVLDVFKEGKSESENLLYFNDDLKTKEEVFLKYGEYLYKKGYVKDGYAESMLERENRASTALGRYIAAPHGSRELVLISSLVIVNLKKTIVWDEYNVDLIFILAVNFSTSMTNQYFFKTLYEIIKDDVLIKKIKKSANLEDIKKILTELEHLEKSR